MRVIYALLAWSIICNVAAVAAVIGKLLDWPVPSPVSWFGFWGIVALLGALGAFVVGGIDERLHDC